MNYQSYKNARDASWSLLIDVSISSLPVDIKPVSYTHLDVYKRQDIYNAEIFTGGSTEKK